MVDRHICHGWVRLFICLSDSFVPQRIIAPMPDIHPITGRSMVVRFVLVVAITGVFAWIASLLVQH